MRSLPSSRPFEAVFFFLSFGRLKTSLELSLTLVFLFCHGRNMVCAASCIDHEADDRQRGSLWLITSLTKANMVDFALFKPATPWVTRLAVMWEACHWIPKALASRIDNFVPELKTLPSVLWSNPTSWVLILIEPPDSLRFEASLLRWHGDCFRVYSSVLLVTECLPVRSTCTEFESLELLRVCLPLLEVDASCSVLKGGACIVLGQPRLSLAEHT